MAALTITAARVGLVKTDSEHQMTGPAGAAITAGQYVRQDATTGRFIPGAATNAGTLGTSGGIAIESASIGSPVTIARPGAWVDLGDALDALAFDAPVYVNDAAGSLGDAAGTTSKIIGYVRAGFAATTADKLLELVY